MINPTSSPIKQIRIFCETTGSKIKDDVILACGLCLHVKHRSQTDVTLMLDVLMMHCKVYNFKGV